MFRSLAGAPSHQCEIPPVKQATISPLCLSRNPVHRLLLKNCMSYIHVAQTELSINICRMLPQIMVAVVVAGAMFTTVSVAEEKCKGGMINQELCQKTCNLSSCFCDMTETSPFSSCAQRCHFSSSCPGMDCSGKPGIFLCKE